MTWKCAMGIWCVGRHDGPRPGELQWSGSGLDTDKGFYCSACVDVFDIPIPVDAPFLSDILNAAKEDSA